LAHQVANPVGATTAISWCFSPRSLADANALSQASVSERSLGIDVGMTWEYGNRTEFTGNLLTWEGRDHIT